MQLLLALASIIRTPRRFAVDGYHSSDLLIQALYPTEKALLKLLRVDAGKDATKGIMRRIAIGQF